LHRASTGQRKAGAIGARFFVPAAGPIFDRNAYANVSGTAKRVSECECCLRISYRFLNAHFTIWEFSFLSARICELVGGFMRSISFGTIVPRRHVQAAS
jgi:hypothetical protein